MKTIARHSRHRGGRDSAERSVVHAEGTDRRPLELASTT
jgi:hypothetical protein